MAVWGYDDQVVPLRPVRTTVLDQPVPRPPTGSGGGSYGPQSGHDAETSRPTTARAVQHFVKVSDFKARRSTPQSSGACGWH